MKFRCECCGQTLLSIGDTIVSNITDFNITEGKWYTVKGYGRLADNVLILNDLGKIEEYSLDYFSMRKIKLS